MALNNIASLAYVYLAKASIDIGERTYYIDEAWIFPILFSPILFVIFLSIICRLIRKKLDSDFYKNINPNIAECSTYGIYRKGYVFALIISTVSVVLTVLIVILLDIFIFEDSWVLIMLLFIIMLSIVILSVIDYIPNFFFKCPKCEERKLVHFRKIIKTSAKDQRQSVNIKKMRVSSSYRLKKRIYFRCKSCGFEVMEYRFIRPKY